MPNILLIIVLLAAACLVLFLVHVLRKNAPKEVVVTLPDGTEETTHSPTGCYIARQFRDHLRSNGDLRIAVGGLPLWWPHHGHFYVDLRTKEVVYAVALNEPYLDFLTGTFGYTIVSATDSDVLSINGKKFHKDEYVVLRPTGKLVTGYNSSAFYHTEHNGGITEQRDFVLRDSQPTLDISLEAESKHSMLSNYFYLLKDVNYL